MPALETTETPTDNPLPLTPDAPISSPFRFSASSSLSPARQEILTAWHRQFLRGAASSLTDLLRLDVELEVDAIQVQTYGQMIAERGTDVQGLLFRMPPASDLWLLDLPLPLSLLLVERMMGGVGVLSGEKTRELTEVEQIIFQQFAETLLGDYARSWQPHAGLRPEIARPVRALPQARSLGRQADDLVLRVGVNVILKEGKSNLWIMVPIAAVEELLLRLGAAEDRARDEAPVLSKDKPTAMGSVPMAVSIRWQGFQLSLRELESMAVGDVLVLDNKRCETAVVLLADRPKFSGRLVREPHKTTLTITESLE
jgi:flagellar motor switch protein FliM